MSIDYVSGNRNLIRAVNSEGRILVADNGNFDLIGDLIDLYKVEAAVLHEERKVEEKALGRDIRFGDLSDGLAGKYRSLADQISLINKDFSTDDYVSIMIRAQEDISPSYLIGMEDFTIAVLSGLGIEPQYMDRGNTWYAQFTRRAIAFTERSQNGEFGLVNGKMFAGLHACDFDTAFQAGELSGEAGIGTVAVGLGGALSDRTWIDGRYFQGKFLEFDLRIPRSYLRVIEIICGLQLGYASVTGERLAMHGLGIGTPILVLLIGALSDRDTFLAVDSTAPIKDAASSKTISLYVDEPAPRKLKADKIIEYWLRDGIEWDCACPYCRNFETRFPSNVTEARDWWLSEGKPKITSSDLYGEAPLTRFFPLLSNPSGEVRSLAAEARIGHNHWVLQRIESFTRDCDSLDLENRIMMVNEKVEAYLSGEGGSAGWQNVVAICWDLVSGTMRQLYEIRSGFHFDKK
ncbi:hypothetical protein [Luteolibacter sp. AS25]|uniref:hypothetical protein n=1 Tax=Luteolibacter sp. AS25 TaxID=3135776 RepID=UPI00398A7635